MLQSVLDKLGIKDEDFVRTCIVIDKLDKLTQEEVVSQLKVK